MSPLRSSACTANQGPTLASGMVVSNPLRVTAVTGERC